MRLDFPPFEPTSFHPCKQLGLEEMTAFTIRVSWEPGEVNDKAGIKEAIEMLESGARVWLDRWMETTEGSKMGFAFYLVEPTLTNSWTERKERIARIELLSSVRVVRGSLRASGTLVRQLGGQLTAGIDHNRRAPR